MEYAELHCKSNYSFLEGASHADELVAIAKERGYRALAVTDRESLAGIVRAHVAAKEHGLPLIVGAEVHPVDAPPAVLWVTNRRGYANLCRLLTVGRRRAVKGSCLLCFDDIAEHREGLIAGVIVNERDEPCVPPPVLEENDCQTLSDEQIGWGSVTSPLPPALRGERGQNKPPQFKNNRPQLRIGHCSIHCYREVFGPDVYLLAELFRGPDDERLLAHFVALSKQTGIPLVAANDARYHAPSRLPLHDVLTAIRHGTTVANAGEQLFPNAERHLRSIEEIRAAFAAVPEAIARTVEIAERSQFNLDELRYEYPEELVPADETSSGYLARLTWEGAKGRYPAGVPDKVRALIERELALIGELHYEAYFLTVHDLVKYARSKDILCQGRGSAANSAVCYCLGVTSVNPEQIDLLFERFISRERNEAPDIDIDFEHERREEVLQYLYDKYGRERAGLAATVITYCCRSAIRDVGKALGFSLDRVDALAKQVEGYHTETLLAERCAEVGIEPESTNGARLVALVNEILGFPRHLSQHVGGMVMTRGPLCELVPIENAAMADRSVVQWDKDDLDALGILKVDVLALGMLTAIRKAFELLEKHHDKKLGLADIPPDDEPVYKMIQAADTIGVFQIESRGQMSMLPRLKPANYYDLVIEVAILRPGPIQGNMVHPYLRRRHGLEPITYPSVALEAVLKKTLGVPLFQEQVMQVAVVAAGFTAGEADQLRRAMGAWRRTGIIEKFRDRFMHGMAANGYTPEKSEELFGQLLGFGGYGFPESHAASFALLVYVSAWIKHYYPAAFCAALLNSQPMGFYAPAQLIQDARDHGVPVRPVDVNHSDDDCTLEPCDHCPALRLGFRMVSGLRVESIHSLLAARNDGHFRTIPELARRARLSRADLERLADADAFGSLAIDRRTALWQSLSQEKAPQPMPLFAGVELDEPVEVLPELTPLEQVFADYRATGFSLKAHPMSFYRDDLCKLSVATSAQLRDWPAGQPVTVAGIVLMRQRPSTAKGITFVTLEDETGKANLIVRQSTWEQFYAIARRSPAWIAHGILEKKDTVIHVLVTRLEDMSEKLSELGTRSRDFR